MTLDAIFEKMDVCGAWRDYFTPESPPLLHLLSPRAIGSAITTLGMLTLHTTQAKLEASLQFSQFAAALIEALLPSVMYALPRQPPRDSNCYPLP